MQRFVLISAAALLISGAPAALAQNGVSPPGPHASATKATIGMAKTRVKGRQAGNHANAMGGSNAAVIKPQNTDEGRTGGGGGGGGGGSGGSSGM
jgi:hypothetical protein